MRLYRSSNRRPGSLAAHRCSLACIRRTRRSAQYGSGHGSQVFTGVSVHCSVSRAFPSPCARAFPSSDYYGSSAPPQGRWRTTRQPAPSRPGRPSADGNPGAVPTFTMNRSSGEVPSAGWARGPAGACGRRRRGPGRLTNSGRPALSGAAGLVQRGEDRGWPSVERSVEFQDRHIFPGVQRVGVDEFHQRVVHV